MKFLYASFLKAVVVPKEIRLLFIFQRAYSHERERSDSGKAEEDARKNVSLPHHLILEGGNAALGVDCFPRFFFLLAGPVVTAAWPRRVCQPVGVDAAAARDIVVVVGQHCGKVEHGFVFFLKPFHLQPVFVSSDSATVKVSLEPGPELGQPSTTLDQSWIKPWSPNLDQIKI